MPEPVIFKDLPATFPEKDKYKKPSVIGWIVFHGLLIFVVIIVPCSCLRRFQSAS